MIPRWLLIAESVGLGLLVALALPVWALVPLLFGVTELTPRRRARPVIALLLLFPPLALGSMVAAFRMDPGRPAAAVWMALPLLHLAVLFAARVRS